MSPIEKWELWYEVGFRHEIHDVGKSGDISATSVNASFRMSILSQAQSRRVLTASFTFTFSMFPSNVPTLFHL